MSLKLYLEEKEIDSIIDDYDFMQKEYETVHTFGIGLKISLKLV